MNLPPRFVSVLGLVQGFFIVAGSLITRTCVDHHLHLARQMAEEAEETFQPYVPRLLQFVHDYGLWCLLVPVVWGLVACWRAETHGANVTLRWPQLPIGVVLTLAAMVVFSLSALRSLLFM